MCKDAYLRTQIQNLIFFSRQLGSSIRKHFRLTMAGVGCSGCSLRWQIGERVRGRQEGQGGEGREHPPPQEAQPPQHYPGQFDKRTALSFECQISISSFTNLFLCSSGFKVLLSLLFYPLVNFSR